MDKIFEKIPDEFWSVFKSVNRDVYIGSMLAINQEYLYNDYFLNKESCFRILSEYYERKEISVSEEDLENDAEKKDPPAARVLNRLIRYGWLKKVEDLNEFVTNITIPNYAGVFLDAFEKIIVPSSNVTEILIQNIYSNIYSVYYDPRGSIELLKAALYNTNQLNKSLQEMLHNMDSFFTSLIRQDSYRELLQEHLFRYVEDVVQKKYHILKTGDNFYIYKNDIKTLLNEISNNEAVIQKLVWQAKRKSNDEEVERDILETIDMIDRAFGSIEKRILNIDIEHNKYIRATVSRLNYLLSHKEDTKGMIITLLNHLKPEQVDDALEGLSESFSFYGIKTVSLESLYKTRKRKELFEESIQETPIKEFELSKKEVLKQNIDKNQYDKRKVINFMENHMVKGMLDTRELKIETAEEFNLLILAYDMSVWKNSEFYTENIDAPPVTNHKFIYPALIFRRRESV